MEIITGILSSISTAVIISFLAFLSRNAILERMKHALQIEHSKFLDEMQWNRKVQEQAAKVAEYMALARGLKKTSPATDYERANRLSWELAVWLPEEIYKQMALAISRPDKDVNELSVAISVRKFLLGEKAGNLSQDDVAHHAPGIGEKGR